MGNCKEKAESFGLEDENGEELESEREGIRVAETEETVIFEASVKAQRSEDEEEEEESTLLLVCSACRIILIFFLFQEKIG